MVTRTSGSISFISFLAILFFPAISYAQDVYEGQVISKTTELAIPGVSVVLLKEKVGTQTNDQGYYNLTSPNKVPNDTLVFSSVGYQTFRQPVSDYQKRMFITLEPSNTQLNQVNVGDRKMKVLVLDKFSVADIKTVYSQGYVTKPFSQSAYAKLFEAPQEHVVLASVQLGRRDFAIARGNAYALTTSNKNTRFLIHILAVDPYTGAPGKVMFTKNITLKDNSQLVKIDLSEDKLVIPTTKFFVAVEWLRIPFNEVIKLDYAPKTVKIRKNGSRLTTDESKYSVLYQPFLVGFRQVKRAPAWVKIDDDIWQHYTDPYYDIALSATIHY
jgi:hypothetical protein